MKFQRCFWFRPFALKQPFEPVFQWEDHPPDLPGRTTAADKFGPPELATSQNKWRHLRIMMADNSYIMADNGE